MKILTSIFTILSCNILICQTDTISYDKYLKYKYDSTLNFEMAVYEYNDLWDFNNDSIYDTLIFKSNGGAHSFFYPIIKISGSKKLFIFPTLLIDMPWLSDISKELSKESIVQFAVKDFDNDKKPEIYLNVSNDFSSLPKSLKSKGIKTRHLLFDFDNLELVVKDYDF